MMTRGSRDVDTEKKYKLFANWDMVGSEYQLSIKLNNEIDK